MKATGLRLLGLGLAVICLSLATQSPAAKGGIPGAPGGEDPPPDPDPTLPFTYQVIPVQSLDISDTAWVTPCSINDYGVIAGVCSVEISPQFRYEEYGMWVEPETTANGIAFNSNTNNAFLITDDGMPWGWRPLYINNQNQIAGLYYYESSIYPYWFSSAGLWSKDGTGTDLGVSLEGIDSRSIAINDAGTIVVSWSSYKTGLLGSGVIAPVPTLGGGAVWFVDDDGNGANDLLMPIASSNLTPVAINEAGQVLFDSGYLLTPDYMDNDGDGNPWYADVDVNGINDLLIALTPLPGDEETGTGTRDINDLGQIVGTSNGRAVRWDDVNSPVDLGQPTKHSHSLYADLINNAGQIIGGCKEKQWGNTTFIIDNNIMYDLNELIPGDTFVRPDDMNDDGWLTTEGAVYILVYPEP